MPEAPERVAGRPRRGAAEQPWQPPDSGGKGGGQSGGEPAIRATGLVRKFGEFRAVDGVSFEVMPGEIFGLLGANGAGKTTVIKMLTGLLPATEGQGRVAGVNMATASGAIRERIGYMSQSFSLYLDMTVLENIQFYAGVYGLFSRRTRERLPRILELTGLEAHRRRMTSDLPMGLRQRLALGCALVHDPQVVFLDEPTSGVDVLGRRRFWQILLRLAREQGVAVLVTTHYMSEAEHCDTLALMYAGRIVAEGPPQRLRDDLEATAGRPLAIKTSEPLKAMRLARRNGYPRAAMFGRNLHVLSRDHAEDQQRLARLFDQAGIERLRAESQEITMEDVFVHCILDQESDS
jgi:ABC-2 type transport system ATP-binding protein